MPDLDIKIGNESLDLPDNINIPLKMNNPMFFDTGSYSLNFNLPPTDVNKKILNYINRIERKSNEKLNEFCTASYGLPLFEATIESDTSTKAGIKCGLFTDMGSFFTGIPKPKLTDLELGGDRTSVDEDALYAAFKDLTTKFYPDADAAMFPILNQGLLDGTPYSFASSAIDVYQNRWILDDPGPVGNFRRKSVGRQVMITPFPYFNYVFKHCFWDNGYSIKENFFETDPDFRQAIIYNANDIDWYHNADFSYNLSKHVPDIKISNMIKGMKNRFATGFFFDNNKRSVVIKKFEDILNDTEFIDISDKANNEPELVNARTNGYKLNFDTGQDGFWDEKIKDVLSTGRHKYTEASSGSFPIPAGNGDIGLTTNKNNEYYYVFDAFSNTWDLVSRAIQNDFIEGDKEFEVSSDVSFLINEKENGFRYAPNNLAWLIPRTYQEGNSFYPKNEISEFPLRLLFWRGMQLTEDSRTYPLGSHDVFDYFNNEISGANLSFRWDGQYGIFKNFWEKYLYWYQYRRKEVDLKINWTIADIANMKFYKKYRIDGVDCLIKNIELNLTKTRIVPGMTTLVKV